MPIASLIECVRGGVVWFLVPFLVSQSSCWLLYFNCVVAVCVMCIVLFFTVLWVGLQAVIVAFPSSPRLLLDP